MPSIAALHGTTFGDVPLRKSSHTAALEIMDSDRVTRYKTRSSRQQQHHSQVPELVSKGQLKSILKTPGAQGTHKKKKKRVRFDADGPRIKEIENVKRVTDMFSCSQCEMAFTSEHLIQQHIRKVHQGRRFPCPVCDHLAKNISHLNQHERLVHRGEGRDHVCPHCNKRFNRASNLETHIRTHTGEKPFICSVCPKEFSRKDHLKNHELIHSGERPFACKECGQSFNRQGAFKRHQRIHTEEKPWKCKWCDFRCNVSSNLTRHERTHKGRKPSEMTSNQSVVKVEPAEDEFCGETISEFDARMEPEENDVLSCSQCDQTFASDQLLQEHTHRAHELWLSAAQGNGLEISGTFARRQGQIFMDMTFTNRAMQQMSGFAIQLNKNSFGITPGQPLQVRSPLPPNQSAEVSLQLNSNGPLQKMEPLTNLQVAIKNDTDVSYFATLMPIHIFLVEDGRMDKRLFLQAWKEIPEQNEIQLTLQNVLNLSADDICSKLQQNNIFTVSRRDVAGQELLYHSLKFTNNIWVLSGLKIQPANPALTLALKSRNMAVVNDKYKAIETILQG